MLKSKIFLDKYIKKGIKMGLFSILKGTKRVYFPGCTTYFKHRDSFELYQKIFFKLGIDFKVVEKKICCGLYAFEAGYDSEARKIARRNFEILKEENIQSIITNEPCCFKMFIQDYPNLLPDWNIKVENIWSLILEKLKEKPGLIKNSRTGVLTYQDSCYLGRYCEIYEEPREILKLIGYELKEMHNSRAESICCGSCGGLAITNPELADKAAKERILDAKRIGVKSMVVASIDDYEILKKNSEDMDVEILELSEVLAVALGIKKKQEQEIWVEEDKFLFGSGSSSEIEEELKEEDYYDKQ